MNRTARPGRRQRGAMLIEGLIAIAVFSVGVLAILTVVLKMTVASADSRYRLQAAQLAESLVSEMRVADPATRVAAYTEGGNAFATWTARIRGTAGLPLMGAAAGTAPLAVSFDAAGQIVTVTVNWRAAQDTATDASHGGIAHHYVTTTSFD
jgi:type IV pilus assembly protein PilV